MHGDSLQAWCSQEPDRVAAFFADEGSLRVHDGPPAVGRPAIAEVARGFMSAFPDMEVSMDRITSESGETAFHWTLRGTNTGPGGTGKRICISGYELWQLSRDGFIEESKGHFDEAEYEAQLEHGVDAAR
ncbi:hypothetical protein BH20VER3_BH20VER3_11660 [soil metagenome]